MRPGTGSSRSGRQWRNWAGNQAAWPAEVAQAKDVGDVATVVASAAARGLRVRPVGAGHSFTPAAVTDGVMLRLDHLTGVTAIERATGRVRVLAGTRLRHLSPALEAAGLALPNLGDIDRQSVSGAIATGTHGTGARLHGIASAVTGLTLVLADGSVLECSADQHADVFEAARVGLGALGVVTEVELQCVPAFRLHAVERPEPLMPLLERLQDEAEGNDHFELYWFPHTDRALTKRNNQVEEGADFAGSLPGWRAWVDDELLANGVFELANRMGARWPAVVPRLARVTARALAAREFSDTSWRVFCSHRAVRFVESEYAVPRAAVGDVLLELRDWVDRHDEALPFPVEVRFLAADDVWLSTAYQRDTAYVAVHQYHRMEHARYFTAFEAIVAEHAGRPHWGKLHTLDASRLRPLYPRFDDFLAVRRRLDPTGVFRNAYLDQVLGP
jgi:L-gulono-1,4-lactone dehydrogenase